MGRDPEPAVPGHYRVLDCTSENCASLPPTIGSWVCDGTLGDEVMVGWRWVFSQGCCPQKGYKALISILILSTQYTQTAFILFTFLLCWLDYKHSDMSLQVFPVPVSVPVIPLACPTSPLLWFSIIFCLEHFLHWKKMTKTFVPSSYLQIPFVSFLMPAALPGHSWLIVLWQCLGAPYTRHPSSKLPESGCVLNMSGSSSLSTNLQQEVLVRLMRDGN